MKGQPFSPGTELYENVNSQTARTCFIGTSLYLAGPLCVVTHSLSELSPDLKRSQHCPADCSHSRPEIIGKARPKGAADDHSRTSEAER